MKFNKLILFCVVLEATLKNAAAHSDSGMCNISNLNLKCTSPWHYCDNGSCKCGPSPPYTAMKCTEDELNVFGFECVTVNTTSYSTYIGLCIYNMGKRLNFTLPVLPELNEELCSKHFNRTGILCGKCKDDHYPLAHSFDMNCVKCPNGKSNWWKFVLAAFLPLTIFYSIVVLFRINVTSSQLHGFVFFCQGFVMPALARDLLLSASGKTGFETCVRYIASLYSIWNLDFLRFFKLNICLRTDTIHTLALDFAVAMYPLLLIMLSYLLVLLYDSNWKPLVIFWKPFGALFMLFKKNWEIKTSLIDAFATFFLLSNAKLLSASFDMLVPVVVYQLNSAGHISHSWNLYYDPTMPYFGEAHLPFALLAVALLVIFVFLPTLLMIVYPLHWFQVMLSFVPFRWYILHTFMDTFQGCYKDGTQPGTFDCRWFSSMLLIVRILAVMIGGLTLNALFFSLFSVVLVITAIILVVVQPFKPSVTHHTDINVVFLLLLALWYVCLSGYQVAQITKTNLITLFLALAALTASTTLVYMSCIIVKWMHNKRKFGVMVIRNLYLQRYGYESLD